MAPVRTSVFRHSVFLMPYVPLTARMCLRFTRSARTVKGLALPISNRLKKAAGFKTIAAEERKVILGITGGTGSGKTSALNAIRDLGVRSLIVTPVYHKMVAENQDLRHAIEVKFHGVFNSDGSLNRKKLGELVFGNKERMEQLNEVIYRFLVPEVQRLCQEGGDLVAIDATSGGKWCRFNL